MPSIREEATLSERSRFCAIEPSRARLGGSSASLASSLVAPLTAVLALLVRRNSLPAIGSGMKTS